MRHIGNREIQRARVIKIDVEGAEIEVLAGMDSILDSCRQDVEIVVEIVPDYLALRGRRPEDVLERFLDAGFYAYSLETEYEDHLYLAPSQGEKRPIRIREPIEVETNVILSRRDAEAL